MSEMKWIPYKEQTYCSFGDYDDWDDDFTCFDYPDCEGCPYLEYELEGNEE